MTDEDTYFDMEFYEELVNCLSSLDPKLLESVNGQWSGFKEYARTGGNPNIDPPDIWKRCELQGVSMISSSINICAILVKNLRVFYCHHLFFHLYSII